MLAAQAAAIGDVNMALVVATIFANTFEGSQNGSPACDPSTPTALARQRILSQMLQMDAVTYSSSAYILQASHAIRGKKKSHVALPSKLGGLGSLTLCS